MTATLFTTHAFPEDVFFHTLAEVPIAMKFSVLPGSGFDKGPLYNRSPSGTAVISYRESELSKQDLMG